MNKKVIIVIIVILLAVCAVITGTVILLNKASDNEPESIQSPEDDTDNGNFEHTTGEPIIDFDDGNENYFDHSLIAYLEHMERGVPAIDENGNYYLKNGEIVYVNGNEEKVEKILDNLILLINHFAKSEYSLEASHQIQRFYVGYYDSLAEIPFNELVDKLAKCFPKDGADPVTFSQSVSNVFGYSIGDYCAFVFDPMTAPQVKIKFYNVLPENITLTDELESLCIYDNWKNADDDGYERNLEMWLHNVISVTSNADFSIEYSIVAQMLYAGSIADAEYLSDWSEALLRCFEIEAFTYDNFKLAVEQEFGVSIDHNQALIECFEVKNTEECK